MPRPDRRLLVTGAGGYLGGVVAARAEADGWSVTGTCLTTAARPDLMPLDVRDRDAVLAVLRQVRPDAVVHAAAAYGDWATTADGSAHVALAAGEVRARLVHVSSDALFPGSPAPYDEHAVLHLCTPTGLPRRRLRRQCARSAHRPPWCAPR